MLCETARRHIVGKRHGQPQQTTGGKSAGTNRCSSALRHCRKNASKIRKRLRSRFRCVSRIVYLRALSALSFVVAADRSIAQWRSAMRDCPARAVAGCWQLQLRQHAPVHSVQPVELQANRFALLPPCSQRIRLRVVHKNGVRSAQQIRNPKRVFWRSRVERSWAMSRLRTIAVAGGPRGCAKRCGPRGQGSGARGLRAPRERSLGFPCAVAGQSTLPCRKTNAPRLRIVRKNSAMRHEARGKVATNRWHLSDRRRAAHLL